MPMKPRRLHRPPRPRPARLDPSRVQTPKMSPKMSPSNFTEKAVPLKRSSPDGYVQARLCETGDIISVEDHSYPLRVEGRAEGSVAVLLG